VALLLWAAGLPSQALGVGGGHGDNEGMPSGGHIIWAASTAASHPAAKSTVVGGSRPIAGGEWREGVGHLTGFGTLRGFGTRCWVICLPMTTKAIPTSSLVPMRWPAMKSGTHKVQHTCGDSSVCAGGVAVASQLGFAPPAGCDRGIDSLAFNVPWCWVYSPSSPLFFFSDPSTSILVVYS
jgi:hypothetical protein